MLLSKFFIFESEKYQYVLLWFLSILIIPSKYKLLVSKTNSISWFSLLNGIILCLSIPFFNLNTFLFG